ncbi:nuclear transport factor 2 family protein [Rhodococcus hoagii]|nr:nuclear transport factor 2 family protein [Prescottella equi]
MTTFYRSASVVLGATLATAALSSCSGNATAGDPTPSPEDAIVAVVEQMNHAYAKGDVEAYYGYYCAAETNNIRRSFSPEEFKAQVSGERSANNGKVTQMSVDDIKVDGDSATATGVIENMEVSGDVNDARRGPVKFVREGGEWKYCTN